MTVTIRAKRDFPVENDNGQGTRLLRAGEEATVSKTRAEGLKELGKATIVGAARKEKAQKQTRRGRKPRTPPPAEQAAEETQTEE